VRIEDSRGGEEQRDLEVFGSYYAWLIIQYTWQLTRGSPHIVSTFTGDKREVTRVNSSRSREKILIN